jgi:hypothetical protein
VRRRRRRPDDAQRGGDGVDEPPEHSCANLPRRARPPLVAFALRGDFHSLVSCSSGQPIGDDNLGRKRKLADGKGRWLAPAYARTRPSTSPRKSRSRLTPHKVAFGERTHKEVVSSRRRVIET